MDKLSTVDLYEQHPGIDDGFDKGNDDTGSHRVLK
jgi:hypothetical protein